MHYRPSHCGRSICSACESADRRIDSDSFPAAIRRRCTDIHCKREWARRRMPELQCKGPEARREHRSDDACAELHNDECGESTEHAATAFNLIPRFRNTGNIE